MNDSVQYIAILHRNNRKSIDFLGLRRFKVWNDHCRIGPMRRSKSCNTAPQHDNYLKNPSDEVEYGSEIPSFVAHWSPENINTSLDRETGIII